MYQWCFKQVYSNCNLDMKQLLFLKKPQKALYQPLTFLPCDLSARAAMQLPREDKDWLMAAPSFRRSPVAPVLSARSLKSISSINLDYIRILSAYLVPTAKLHSHTL